MSDCTRLELGSSCTYYNTLRGFFKRRLLRCFCSQKYELTIAPDKLTVPNGTKFTSLQSNPRESQRIPHLKRQSSQSSHQILQDVQIPDDSTSFFRAVCQNRIQSKSNSWSQGQSNARFLCQLWSKFFARSAQRHVVLRVSQRP